MSGKSSFSGEHECVPQIYICLQMDVSGLLCPGGINATNTERYGHREERGITDSNDVIDCFAQQVTAYLVHWKVERMVTRLHVHGWRCL